MTPEQLGWAAGVIDGEGCFNIVGPNRGGFAARIMVVNTDRGLLEKLKALFGGDIQTNKRSARPGWKPLLVWRLSHRDALDLAETVYGHLTVKKRAAWAFLAWRAVQEEYKQNRRKPYYLAIKEYLHSVNRKGVPA